jgi:hypothetical protein
MKKLTTTQEYLGNVVLPNPEFGDLKLNVFPITQNGNWIKLPKQFKEYEESLNEIMSNVPMQENANKHYVTIDSKFFTTKDFLRREGVHIDGNFCADPKFKGSTWGGTSTTWGGTHCSPELKITTNWVSEHNIEIPLGTYVSDNLGGLIVVSNEIGCKAWTGDFKGLIGNEGDFSAMENQLKKDNEIILGKDEVWMLSSNTPHETLLIEQGERRTFMRITLAHNYNNVEIFKQQKSA